jgi:hypothetical protein
LNHDEAFRKLTLRINVPESHGRLNRKREIDSVNEGRALVETLEVVTTGTSHEKVEESEGKNDCKIPR